MECEFRAAAVHERLLLRRLIQQVPHAIQGLAPMTVAAPRIVAPMREILEDIREHQPPDPNEAARRGMRPRLRQRFYKEVAVSEGEGGFGLALDGRPVRTPAQRPLVAPIASLADMLAEEWRA